MSDAQDAISDIGVVAETTEKLSLFLDSTGIELSAFWLQFAALIIAVAVFVMLLLVVWKKTENGRYVAIAGLAPLLLLLSGHVEAAGISGQVVDAKSRKPMQAIEIILKGFGGQHRISRATDSDGRFALQLTEILPAEALQRCSLNLLFSQQGYIAQSILIECMPGAAFNLDHQRVELTPVEGSFTPAPGTYTTLYVLPYQVARGSNLFDPLEMQSLITEYLTSGVDMYLQEIAEPPPIETFVLQRLGIDTEVEISNTARVRGNSSSIPPVT